MGAQLSLKTVVILGPGYWHNHVAKIMALITNGGTIYIIWSPCFPMASEICKIVYDEFNTQWPFYTIWCRSRSAFEHVTACHLINGKPLPKQTLVVKWTATWNYKSNTIRENAFENVCKMGIIITRPNRVNWNNCKHATYYIVLIRSS